MEGSPREQGADRSSLWTRRNFVMAGGLAAAAGITPVILSRRSAQAQPHIVQDTKASQERPLRIGVIGCGGRGTGAAENALAASDRTRIVALADLFSDRMQSAREGLATLGERAVVEESRCYVGFDAYTKLLAIKEVDVVILATPPHFRPMHFEASVNAGKHVFMEKPVATDATGIRKVLAAADVADAKNLCVVAGTQRRHEKCYLEAMQRLRDGAIGKIIAGRVYWNMEDLWMNPPRPEWSEMEWQLRNWLYFTWLSGDHYVEQHVHNLDVANWAIGSHPARCMGMGGRQVRTDPNYGNIFDHFAVEYEYPDGTYVMSMARQTKGCASRVSERFHGTRGVMYTRSGVANIASPAGDWKFTGDNGNPYDDEHRDLYAAVDSGSHINEARQVAESTMTAIMGRMSAYTGQEVTWEDAINSPEDLSPARYEFGPYPTPEVPMPGKTKLLKAEPTATKPA